MLIDVHAHFYHDQSGRADWEALNQSRLAAGNRIGVTCHVASVLGSWGRTSPTYFPSPADLDAGNAWMARLARASAGRVMGYLTLNPNFTGHSLERISGMDVAAFIGLKLAASRRADDPLLDPICERAAQLRLPVLHHIWQHRRGEWPGQEASDAVELCRLADRHPAAQFILAHIGGGGDWTHSLRAVRRHPNVLVDLSGSGVDGGMLELTLRTVGVERMLWGADVTLCTGWAKLRRLERMLGAADLELVRSGNAVRVFPAGSFA